MTKPEDYVTLPMEISSVRRRRWPIRADSYRREDRIFSIILKAALVLGVVAVECIVIGAFAWVMWRAASS